MDLITRSRSPVQSGEEKGWDTVITRMVLHGGTNESDLLISGRPVVPHIHQVSG